MAIIGYIDAITPEGVIGWAADTADFGRTLTVNVFQADRLVAHVVADMPRDDLASHGIGDGRHAFEIAFPVSDAALVACVVRGAHVELPRSAAPDGSPRYRGQFQHSLDTGFPRVRHGFRDGPMPASADAVVKRLRAAFADRSGGGGNLGGVWGPLVEAHHAEIFHLLKSGGDREVADYLFNAAAQRLTEGFFDGAAGAGMLRSNWRHRRELAALHFDRLVSLAEALGCIPVQNPEQGEWDGNFSHKADDLVAMIEDRIGLDITPPAGLSGYFGIETRRGVFNFRLLDAIYAAYRIREIAGRDAAVVEIGGGAGLVAYYAASMGLRRYTIVDLPAVGVLQSFVLATSLPPTARVQMPGDHDGQVVRILPAGSRDLGRGADLLFAQDNMPEFSREIALDYVRACRDFGIPKVLSINHEARAPVGGVPQNLVADLFDEIGGFRRALRMRHWMRPGYVEEVYESTL